MLSASDKLLVVQWLSYRDQGCCWFRTADVMSPRRIFVEAKGGEPRFDTADSVETDYNVAEGAKLPEGVSLDSPLRLKVAAKLAFPMGGLTDSGLRREIDRGRLQAEQIAGKLYTTLADINRMRESCRVTAKVRVSGDVLREGRTESSSPRQSGSSKTEKNISPQAALRARLKGTRPREPKKH
jgi:hypothetical protein